MALSKKNRIKKKKDLDEVFKRGKAVKGRFLLVKFMVSKDNLSKAVVAISNKTQKKAVLRNAARRVITQEIQPYLSELKKYIAILVHTFPKEQSWREILGEEAKNLIEKIR